MVIFVHMASVWVPFTSESKEAIADYDEIRKEIRLALQECGRRLGVFLRRRERAKSEFRRRNIFELYIEEVAEACGRLKGGKLQVDKLKDQLQKIATKRTGGEQTDLALGKTESGPEGLPHSIIVTPEGVEGELPMQAAGNGGASSGNGAGDLSDPVATGEAEKETEKPAPEKRPAVRTKRPKARTQKKPVRRKVSMKTTSRKSGKDRKRKRK